MPLLQIRAEEDRPVCPSGSDLSALLGMALSRDPGPITIMVHGYKYQPGHAQHCPETSLFSLTPDGKRRRGMSWPRHLGLRGQPGEGLGIGFGWQARGTIWQAYAEAARAGAALSDLLDQLHHIAPARPLRIVAHSLGARVALRAMALCRRARVRTIVLLAAAEYDSLARDALSAAGGADCDLLNVTSRENDLFDCLFERLLSPPRRGDRVLGAAQALPRSATLQLDDAQALHGLRQYGFAIAPPGARICHWSAYLRPGVFPLYRAVLDGRMPVARLRALLPEPEPRWSRLRPRLAINRPYTPTGSPA